MTIRITDVDAYIAAASPEHQEALSRVRDLIHATVPGLEEVIDYGMPVFKRNGEMLTAMASRKQYVSLYCNTEAVERHREELGKLNVGKGCIRFRKLTDLPVGAVEAILRES